MPTHRAKPTWAETKVLECAGIPADEADEWLVALAGMCLNRCYYIDQSARELLRVLDTPAMHRIY